VGDVEYLVHCGIVIDSTTKEKRLSDHVVYVSY